MRLAQNDVLYSASGDPQCAACHGQADLVATDRRAADNIVKAGWSALIASLLGFLGQAALLGIIAYLFVATAAISGIFALSSLGSGNEHFAKYLTGGQRAQTTVLAIIPPAAGRSAHGVRGPARPVRRIGGPGESDVKHHHDRPAVADHRLKRC